LEERLEEQEGEEGDVSSCWMTLRKQEDTGSWRRKLRIALFRELSLEEVMDLSQDRLLLELEYKIKSSVRVNMYKTRNFSFLSMCYVLR
jgi:hypothetical protein